MSQSIFDTINPSTTSGNALAALLNDFKNAVVSGFSGTSRPSQLQAGGYWIDITGDGTGIWLFKIYDGTQDLTIFTLNKNTGLATISSADANFQITKGSNDAVGAQLKLLKKRLTGLGQTQTGDVLGEVQFNGTRDDGVTAIQAKIKSVSQNNVTSAQAGGYIAFEVSPLNGTSLAEVMRVIDGRVGVGVTAPESTLHVKGLTGIRSERATDDAVSSKVAIVKKRVSGAGQVLASDVLGQVEFSGTDNAGAGVAQAMIEVSARENVTTAAQGSRVKIRNKKAGATAYTDQIVIDDKTIIDDVEVTNGVVVKGTNGVRAERAVDSAVGPVQTFRKARVATSGQVVTSDSVGKTEYKSTTNTGAEVVVAEMEVVARETQTATNQGTKVVIRNKKQGTNVLVDQIVIEDKVTIADLHVTNFTATKSEIGTIVEHVDASLLVNKGANQAAANTQTAGIEVAMTNAPHFKFGYDSTKTSKFVAGEVGALKEVVNVDGAQTLTNKTINTANNTVTTPQGELGAALATLQTNIDAVAGLTSGNQPKVRPSLSLDFANTQELDPRITFSRPSVATRVNSRGLIETVGPDVPRFDFDPTTGESLGLLIEESRTNIVTHSEQFDNAAWTKNRATIAVNAAIAPDGTTTSDKLVETAEASTHNFTQNATVATLNAAHTVSVFLKAGERNHAFLMIVSGSTSANNVAATFNLSDGSVYGSVQNNGTGSGGVAKIEAFPNGWYRCSVTGTPDTSGTNIQAQLRLHNGSTTSYTGDGTSGIYVWGAQLTTGAFPTSYIKTEGSTVTRSADLASMTGTNFSSWYRQDEGTFTARASLIETIGMNREFVSLSNGTTSHRIELRTSSASGTIQMVSVDSGVTQTSQTAGLAASKSVPFSVALGFKLNDYAASVNGLSVSSDTSATVSASVNSLSFFSDATRANSYSGHLSRISYYPKRLTNAELQTVSA